MMAFIRTLVYSNFFVALVLFGLTLSTYWAIPALEFKWYFPLGVGLGSWVSYNFHRFLKYLALKKIQNLSEKFRWFEVNLKGLIFISFLAAGLVIWLATQFLWQNIVFLLPAAFIATAYSVRFLPLGEGFYSLRDIPYLKPFIIALVVTYVTMAFPVLVQLNTESIWSSEMMMAFTERFLFILAMTIPFELRDIQSDLKEELRTIGTEFGFSNGKVLVLFTLGAWFIASFLMMWSGLENGLHAAFPFLLLTVSCYALYSLKEAWTELHYSLVFEGLLVIYAVLKMAEGNFQIVP